MKSKKRINTPMSPLEQKMAEVWYKWECFRKEPNWRDLDYSTYVPPQNAS